MLSHLSTKQTITLSLYLNEHKKGGPRHMMLEIQVFVLAWDRHN